MSKTVISFVLAALLAGAGVEAYAQSSQSPSVPVPNSTTPSAPAKGTIEPPRGSSSANTPTLGEPTTHAAPQKNGSASDNAGATTSSPPRHQQQ